MTVYADVLFAVNMIVDYFLLRACAAFLHKKPKTMRLILSAAVGGISSIYIFFPYRLVVTDVLVKVTVCILMALCAFGLGNVKHLLKNSAVLFIITCAYAGVMTALWITFRPKGMYINNSVVYFDISPLVLVIFTVVGYIIFIICNLIFSRSALRSEKCEVKVTVGDKSIDMTAIADTGNSVRDVFGNSEVIIADKKCVAKLFEGFENNRDGRYDSRYRALPCNTVSGTDMLDGYRCDSAVIKSKGAAITLEKPILAVSKTAFTDDYSAIINPDILE